GLKSRQRSTGDPEGSSERRVNGNVGTGTGFLTVIVRTGKAVAEADVVFAEEAERLGRIKVQAVVVALGVLKVADALARELATHVRSGSRRSGCRVAGARWCGQSSCSQEAAGKALNPVNHLGGARLHRLAVQ